MKLKFDELRQAVDFMEKHLGTGGLIYVKHDHQLDALVFSYKSLVDTDTEIELYNAEKGVYPSIQERVWLHKVRK